MAGPPSGETPPAQGRQPGPPRRRQHKPRKGFWPFLTSGSRASSGYNNTFDADNFVSHRRWLPRPLHDAVEWLTGDASGRPGVRLPRPVRRLIGFFLSFHPVVLGVMCLAAAGAVAGGAYYTAVYRPEHARRDAVTAGWKAFETAFQTGDEPGLKAALDKVIAATQPADPLAVRRRKALDTGEADATDAPMTLVTLRFALRAGDLKAADREAAKRLTHEPKEWLALCVRARAALDRRDSAAAGKFLDDLPKPDDAKARIDPAGVLFALELLRATGRDTDPLTGFIRVAVVPYLRTPAAQNFPAAVKAQLLACYLEAFETAPGKPQPSGLSGSWAAASGLFDAAADAAVTAGDTATLTTLGRLVPRLAAGLAALRKDGQVTEEQYPPLRAEMADRGKKVWEAVLAKDPKNAEAYRGLALLKWQAGDYPGAREAVTTGLAAAGDDPPLAALFATMLQAEDRPEQAAAALWEKAEKHPDKIVWWVLAAESASAARRRDLALKACDRGLAADPKNPWLIRLESRLWMEAGDPNRAAQRVQALGPAALTTDPAVARVYARALVEAGLEVLVDGYIADAEKSARDRDDPAAVAAALRGLTDARPAGPDPVLMEQTAERADRLLARWRDQPELLRARGFALAKAAESGTPAWDSTRVRQAVSALERVAARFPDDRDAAAALAWVRLKGQKDPARAVRDAAPLAQAEPVQPLTPGQLETLGAVLLAAGKPADAIRVLERSRRAGPSARGLTLLARAYLAADRKADARTALRAAASLPHSEPDHADYIDVTRSLDQETP